MGRLNDLKLFIKGHLWLVPILAVLVGLFIWALDPAPPNHLSMATGSPGGGYQAFGERLKARLAEDDIELDLVPSTGSPDNLQKLLDHQVEVALVQSGTELNLAQQQRDQLRGLGVMYREPLWLFHRRDTPVGELADLRGLKVGLGAPGSGTLAVVERLLGAAGIQREPGWDEMSDAEASRRLRDGDLDAVFLVAPPDNSRVVELAADPALELAGLRRTEAYARHFSYLTRVEVPEGLLNLPSNAPTRNLEVLSPMATLVANGDLHPALTPLLLEAARDVLADGNLLDEPGSFPRALPMTFQSTTEAEAYFRNGPPYLQRYLPFKIASLVDRWIVLLIPFIAILLPLFKSVSPIYQWRIRSRIYRWYRDLREIEAQLHSGAISGQEQVHIDHLRQVEDELAQVEVPLSYSHELYQLHLHVRYMINRLENAQNPPAQA